MHASDIMSTPVISIPPSLPVPEIAALLHERRIGGVPVMAGTELVGIVTESDLVRRQEIGTDHLADHRPWWRRLQQANDVARDYVKSHGRTAAHVMTREVTVVEASAEISHIATILEQRHIGRLPVVAGRRVVGLVARADLVKMLADRTARSAQSAHVDDRTIRQLVLEELRGQEWWNGGADSVEVQSGVVIFRGVVENEAHRLACRVAAENQPGVRGVQDDRMLVADLPSML